MVAALTIAVIAIVIAGIGLYHRMSGSSYSDQEVNDAKAATCKASLLATRSVVRNTHLKNPEPDNPLGSLAVAANARLALSSGGAYLHDSLSTQPATPENLRNAVESLANTLEGLGVSYMAGESNEAREPMRKDLDSQIKEIDGLCK
jgi:hypothetical protein